MPALIEILLSLCLSTVCAVWGYKVGFRRGFELGEKPDVDFINHLRLPTADEIEKQCRPPKSALIASTFGIE
jgi:hypothetical protein